jgi:hypothetical protein
MLQLLVAHASDYLTREESETSLARHLTGYYRFLGKSLMLGREKQFWDYHKRELTKAGVGFNGARLAEGALAALWDAALNPKNTVEKLLRAKHRQDSEDSPCSSLDKSDKRLQIDTGR